MNRLLRNSLIVGSLIVLGIAALSFNVLLVDWRLGEIDTSLVSISSPEDTDRSSAMLGRMELLRIRADEGAESDGNGVLEARLQALAASQDTIEEPVSGNKAASPAEPLMRATANVIRLILGKTAIQTAKLDGKIVKKLRQAYLWERARKFSTAIGMYRAIEAEGGMSPEAQTNLDIHLAYCLALDSKRVEARTIFETVIYRNPGTEVAALAVKMIFYIDYFESKLRQSAMNETEDDYLVRGRRQFFLAEYGPAVRSLQAYVETAARAKPQEGLYYLGRSLEETGQSEEAELSYRQLIFIDKNSEWSRQAYRRLYFLGGIYGQKPSLAEEAKNYLQASGQSVWVSAVSSTTDLIQAISDEPAINPSEPDSTATASVSISSTPSPPPDSWVLIESTLAGIPVLVDSVVVGTTPHFLKVHPGTIHVFGIETTRGKAYRRWSAPEQPGSWSKIRIDPVSEPEKLAAFSQPETEKAVVAVLNEKKLPTYPPLAGHDSVLPQISTAGPQSHADLRAPAANNVPQIALIPPPETLIGSGEFSHEKPANVPAITSFIVAGAALGTLGVSIGLGAQTYSDYKNTSNSSNFSALRETLGMHQGLNIATGIAGGLGILTGIIFLLTEPEGTQKNAGSIDNRQH